MDRANNQDPGLDTCQTERSRGLANAAEACALAGVSPHIEQLIYEAGRLQDAASVLNRLARE
jgi:hypothetical protein